MDVMGLGNKLCRGVIWPCFCIEILPSTEDADKTLYVHGIDWITKLVQDFCSNSRSSGATSRKVLMFKTAKVQPAVPTELQCQSRMKSCKKKSKRVLNACILFCWWFFFTDCTVGLYHHQIPPFGRVFFCSLFPSIMAKQMYACWRSNLFMGLSQHLTPPRMLQVFLKLLRITSKAKTRCWINSNSIHLTIICFHLDIRFTVHIYSFCWHKIYIFYTNINIYIYIPYLGLTSETDASSCSNSPQTSPTKPLVVRTASNKRLRTAGFNVTFVLMHRKIKRWPRRRSFYQMFCGVLYIPMI